MLTLAGFVWPFLCFALFFFCLCICYLKHPCLSLSLYSIVCWHECASIRGRYLSKQLFSRCFYPQWFRPDSLTRSKCRAYLFCRPQSVLFFYSLNIFVICLSVIYVFLLLTCWPFICLPVPLFFQFIYCLSICLSVCLSVCLSFYRSIVLSIYRSTYHYICSSSYCSIVLSIILSFFCSIYHSIYRSIYLAVDWSFCPSIILMFYFLYLSFYCSRYLAIILSIYCSVYLFCQLLYLSFYLSFFHLIYLTFYPSFVLSISWYIFFLYNSIYYLFYWLFYQSMVMFNVPSICCSFYLLFFLFVDEDFKSYHSIYLSFL